jgi:hypothetical protein
LLKVEASSDKDHNVKHDSQIKVGFIRVGGLNTVHDVAQSRPNDEHVVEETGHHQQETHDDRQLLFL